MARKPKPGTAIVQSILDGTAPAGLRVPGKLDFSEFPVLTKLPEDLSVGWLDVTGCDSLAALPKSLKVRRLSWHNYRGDAHRLEGVSCFQLDLPNSSLVEIPKGLQVTHRLDLTESKALRSLPENFSVESLVLRDCTSLESLPEGLTCYFLDVSGCTALSGWPTKANVSVGRLSARGCHQLSAIPAWLTSLAQLDLRDCRNIRQVPEGLNITSWIDIAGTGIRSLPKSLNGVQIRWRGVPIDARIAFFPETISTDQVLGEGNAEKRRVLLERMGYERFLREAEAEVLDADRDPGGERKLLRVAIKDDEALVCISVFCPSTGRQYMIRVPPTTSTCHQAAAWIAGFDDPDLYQPLVES